MIIHYAAAAGIVAELVAKVSTHPSGRKGVIAVVDSHGELISLARMDGAALSSLQLAMNKAYTAARAARTSEELGKKVASLGTSIANFGDARYTGFGGGVPVRHNGEVIGAVAISGLAEEDDIALATWAAEKLAQPTPTASDALSAS